MGGLAFDVGIAPLLMIVLFAAGVASLLLTGWIRGVLLAVLLATFVVLFALGWQSFAWREPRDRTPEPLSPAPTQPQPWERPTP